MTESTESTATAAPARKAGGLSSMLLPELRQVAGGLGIKATGMKKAELVAAIRAAQGGGQAGSQRGGETGGQGGGARRERPTGDPQDRQQDAQKDAQATQDQPS
ncbi:MAG TPA: Rho termination factor N-terminal domain-containing protein, partial [Acidimicrobiales bacterium]